ncbi:MAG: Glycosyltransferase [uncultured Rubrobacteraceae bacterium]|uniref:Glycosyltransferase n=1 Tax=uncultured Rubrobacteraceae bacterium TaxID=349277 RepID=A0A6J4RFN9_9ACTN|nr:MAG: Glycosyltransferase [uncultured Rubrobacteraceae bacterium]
MNVLVWQIHGSYLNTLVRSFAGGPHRFYLPTKPDKPEGYGGRGPTFPWSDETVNVPAEDVRDLDLDLVIYQSEKNLREDAREILTEGQRALPAIFLEHNTPQGRINDMVHPVDDPGILLVHVTHFNDLFWDARRTPTRVIDHAVVPTGGGYTGGVERGVSLVNDLPRRERVVGGDVFLRAREEVPLDLFGFNSREVGGLGDLPQAEVHEKMKPYRFYFNPIRYTSLPLSVLEAMELGLPVVALATTELVSVIKDGENGVIATDVGYLIERMRGLLGDPGEARRLGEAGRRTIRDRFGLERFAMDWEAAFEEAAALRKEVPCASL